MTRKINTHQSLNNEYYSKHYNVKTLNPKLCTYPITMTIVIPDNNEGIMNNHRHNKKILIARIICFLCLLVSFWLDPMVLFNLERVTLLEGVLLSTALLCGIFMISVSFLSKRR